MESWKEISDYLKRTVKTCQRWEQELDLPIRRLEDAPRARVYAYKDELDFWLKDKLDNQDTTTKYLSTAKKKPKRLWIVLPIVLVLIITAVLTIHFIPGIDFISLPPEKPHLAVLPIINHTGDDSYAYLQDSLTNLIVSDLYQSKYLRVTTVERTNEILKDMNMLDMDTFTTEDLKKIASLDDVTHFLTGFVTKFGNKFRISISIQESGKWKTIWSDQMDGVENDMFDMVDTLTLMLKPQLNLSDEQIADDFDSDVEEVVTTANDRAYRFYIQAHKAMNNTEWELAITLFERATALDPDFAMAYRFLSGVYNHLALVTGDQSYWDKYRDAGQKSRDAAVRRPPSERERLIIEGAYIYPSNPKEEMEKFKELLELYPDDNYGNYRMGVRYRQGENYYRAETHLKRIVDFTNNGATFYHLSQIYMDQRMYAEAEDVLETGLQRFPNNSLLYQSMARFHVLRQEFEEALFWCGRGFEVEPIQFRDSLTRGDVLLFRGNFSESEEEYRSCLSSTNNKTRMDAAISLMQLYKTQGRYKDAEIQAETAMKTIEKNREWDFDPLNTELVRMLAKRGNNQEAFRIWDEVIDRPTRYKLQGEIYLKEHQWAEAEDVFNQIEEEVNKEKNSKLAQYLAQDGWEPPFGIRFLKILFHLKAGQAFVRGEYAQTITHVEQARSLYPGLNLIPADLIDIAGKAYYRSGDLESAKGQFEWISEMTYNRKEFGEIYARSFFMLGKIYEELGKKRDAKRNYKRFLDLWQKADTGIPEVDAARIRLAVLQ